MNNSVTLTLEIDGKGNLLFPNKLGDLYKLSTTLRCPSRKDAIQTAILIIRGYGLMKDCNPNVCTTVIQEAEDCMVGVVKRLESCITDDVSLHVRKIIDVDVIIKEDLNSQS